MDINDVANAILSNPDVQEKAMSYVHQTHYPDMAAEEFVSKVKPTNRKPIFVTDPNDPKLKSYTDSLNLYKKGESNYGKYLEANQRLNIPNSSTRIVDNPYVYDGDSPAKIQPIQSHRYWYSYNPDVISGTNLPSNTVPPWTDRYQKPVQPVKLKPTYEEFLKTVNPDFIGDDYNLEEAYKNLPYEVTSAWAKDPNKNHLPDTYKLPNHETFSNESIYYKKGMKAGRWEGDNYIPIEPTVIPETKKYTSPKQFYQGRDFMEATGFRPGYFHPEEVEEAKKSKK